MEDKLYKKIADSHKPKETKLKNLIIAFVVGGLIGCFGEIIIEIMCSFFHKSRAQAQVFMSVFFIFIASLLTALGFFDKLVNKCKCGLLIPITGFAHSMTSAALDYRKEGLIYGIGSNIFKLAGSVILYGVVSAWLFGMIRYFIGGVL